MRGAAIGLIALLLTGAAPEDPTATDGTKAASERASSTTEPPKPSDGAASSGSTRTPKSSDGSTSGAARPTQGTPSGAAPSASKTSDATKSAGAVSPDGAASRSKGTSEASEGSTAGASTRSAKPADAEPSAARRDTDDEDAEEEDDGADDDGDADEGVPAEPPDDPTRISFEDHLGLRRDLTLQGVFTEQRVDFALPRGWKPSADAVLHLTVSHSAALQAERSHLSVEVNGQSLRSFSLDASNEEDAELTVRIPRRLLRDYNNVDLRVVQHHTDACEDPFDPALWTRVSSASWIELPHRRAPVTDGLEAWPHPVVDARGYGPVILTPVMTGPPDANVTAALGELAVTLGRLASYRGVHVEPAVTDVSAAVGTALLVGLARDLPQLPALLGAPVELGTGEGLVAVVPSPTDPSRPVLVVVGNDAGGLSKAVHALTGQDRQPILSGAAAVVRSATAGTPPPRKELPRPFPASERATLKDLGLDDLTVRGRYAPTVTIPLRVEGDAAWRAGGGELDLRYAYAAQVDTRLSALEVRLDGITLRSVSLNETNGAQDARLKVQLPEELLTPSSELEVVFHLLPQEFDLCTSWTTDQHLWGTVLSTSTITLGRDHVADMPDLSLVRHGLWPYLADAAHPVVVGLPGAPDAADWAAGLELVAALARASAADAPAVRLALGSAALAAGPEQLVLLGNARTNAAVNALAPLLTVTDEGPARRLKAGAPALLIEAASTAQSDTLEQVARDGARSALVLSAASAEGLQRLVDTLTDPDRRARLGGNAVTVAPDGTMRILDVAPRSAWGELPIDARARAVIQRDGWIPGVAVAAGAVIVVMLVRRIARRGRT